MYPGYGRKTHRAGYNISSIKRDMRKSYDGSNHRAPSLWGSARLLIKSSFFWNRHHVLLCDQFKRLLWDARAHYLNHSHLVCLTLCFYYIEFELNPFGSALHWREVGSIRKREGICKVGKVPLGSGCLDPSGRNRGKGASGREAPLPSTWWNVGSSSYITRASLPPTCVVNFLKASSGYHCPVQKPPWHHPALSIKPKFYTVSHHLRFALDLPLRFKFFPFLSSHSPAKHTQLPLGACCSQASDPTWWSRPRQMSSQPQLLTQPLWKELAVTALKDCGILCVLLYDN